MNPKRIVVAILLVLFPVAGFAGEAQPPAAAPPEAAPPEIAPAKAAPPEVAPPETTPPEEAEPEVAKEALCPVVLGLKLLPFEKPEERRLIEGFAYKSRALEVEEVRPGSGKVVYKALPDTPENRRVAGIRVRWIRGLPGEMLISYQQIDTVQWKDPITKDRLSKIEEDAKRKQKEAAAAEEKRVRMLEAEWRELNARSEQKKVEVEDKREMPKTKEFAVLRKFPPEKGWGALRYRELMLYSARRTPALTSDERDFLEAFNNGTWSRAKEIWDAVQERWKQEDTKKAEEDAKKEAEKKAPEPKEPAPPK